MKRTLSLLLAALLCSTALAACAQNDPPAGTETTAAPVSTDATAAAETTDDGKDENGFLRDTLPDDLKFTGETISILTWSDVEHEEFTVEAITGELVNDAIFQRNHTVEERLGVTLSFYGVPGNYNNLSNYTAHVTNAVQAGSHDFDMCAAYSMTMATVGTQGYLLNLLDLPYLNFEMPWWPERLTQEATINNKLFFASGDISANVLYMMYTCFYNKDLLTDYGLEDPQQLVQKGQWTYDKFFEMCQGVYKDLNGNNVKDNEDQFGYLTSEGIHVDPWFYNTGAIIVEKDADGNLALSSSFTSEKVIAAIEQLNRNFWETNDCFYTSPVNTHQKTFPAGQLLFCIDRARVAIRNFADSEVNYGIVPCPVQEASQQYVTVVGNPFSLYALPIDCRDPEMMAAVMECYASESYRTVTPALFEITLKIKYSDTDISSQMYDIIRENVTFDLGRLYTSQLGLINNFQTMIIQNQNNWASMAKILEKKANKTLSDIQKSFE